MLVGLGTGHIICMKLTIVVSYWNCLVVVTSNRISLQRSDRLVEQDGLLLYTLLHVVQAI